MTECQGCGAWNDASRAVCVLCGTPLAETDEWDAGENPPPLPPLPDGGLAAAMPDWLRDAPPPLAPPAPVPESSLPARRPLEPIVPTLGPRADPRTFLTDDDFPPWLRDLAARQLPRASRTPAAPPPLPAARDDALPWPVWPHASAEPSAAAALPPPPSEALAPPAAAVAPRVPARHQQPLWERVLLALVFLGVIIAALWALIANGVIG
ncbi:MAG: hypothetical protein U0031_22080 [Thermomicrobiales bacterium]